MFTKARNLDQSFKQVRFLCLSVVIACVIVCCFAIYKSSSMVLAMQDKIYVLANGKAIEAYASDRASNLQVEARGHVRSFHQLFFALDPDDKVIKENIAQALYLADNSAKMEYDNLKEKSYYSNIISANISQKIYVDSVIIDLENHPYPFRCVARLEIIRSTSIIQRNLVTTGYLRSVSRSDNNTYGFLIEQWKIVENNDIGIKQR